MAYAEERINEQDVLIRHYQNLFGYTESAVNQAIKEIREDAGDNPNDLQKMLLERADDMERSLNAIREVTG